MFNKSSNTEYPDIEIEEMEIEDVAEVFQLGEEIFTAENHSSLYRTWDEYELLERFNSDKELCLVAKSEGKIIGFIIGSLIEKRRSAWTYGYIIWIGVSPRYARKKVGERLLKKIFRLFKDKGVRIIMIDTASSNRRAISFFRKHGFDDESEHVYMYRNISKARKDLPRRLPERSPRKWIED